MSLAPKQLPGETVAYTVGMLSAFLVVSSALNCGKLVEQE